MTRVLLSCAFASCALVLSLDAADSSSWAEHYGSRSGRETFNPDECPYLMRLGFQGLSGDVDGELNNKPFSITNKGGYRAHLDVLMIVQPYEYRPALLLGVGASRTVWDLSSNADLVSHHVLGEVGIAQPLSTNNMWRLEALADFGIGRGILGDDVDSGTAREYGVDVDFVFPLVVSWRLEGSASLGWYHSTIGSEGGSFIQKGGSSVPVQLPISTDGFTYGLAVTWRP